MDWGLVSDGVSASGKEVMDWSDSRLFSNGNFRESRWGPDNWPSDVKTASVQARLLLILEIDIQKMSNGKQVINWDVDGLDLVLDGLGIYEGGDSPSSIPSVLVSVDTRWRTMSQSRHSNGGN